MRAWKMIDSLGKMTRHPRLATGPALRGAPGALLLAVLAIALAATTSAAAGTSRPSSSTQPVLPSTRLVALPGARPVIGTNSIHVTLTGPVAASTPMPMLTPRNAGSWKAEGDSLVFTPASTLAPCSRYTLTIWARTDASGHAMLGRKRVVPLAVACPSTEGLQEALVRLGYLGDRFRPMSGTRASGGELTRRQAALDAYEPERGRLTREFAGAPLAHLGGFEALTRGALMVYQGERGLAVSGEVNGATWESLLYDLTHYRRDPHPYTWVTVTESLPETLEVHVGSRVRIRTPTNTGVPGAETATGVFPIYARYVSTSMAGEDPDGVKYDVPDVPWVNYFNGGDAVHGYPREAYGFPQSNGCVELPIETSRYVFGLLQLGDIVWVS